nr:MAG TPA: tail collar fiber protein [Caudoviricetes sp.]
MKQYTLLTASGINKLLKTASDGSKIALKEVVVSDYDGELSEQTTSIPNEKYRGAINAVTIDESDSNILDVDAVIPPEVGGFYIKTAGIYCDDGSLFAVARLADTYKPLLNEGSSKDITLNFKLQIANASESIILKVDNNIVLATRKWCEKMFLKLKDKIDAYTKSESDDKFVAKTDKATETKAGITKLKNSINAKAEDMAVTEKAVSEFVAASQSGLGIGQTWQDVKNNRNLGINYTNDTTKPIFIIVGRRGDGSPYPLKVFVSGVLVYEGRTNHNAIGVNKVASVVVPVGKTYKIEMSGIDLQTDEQFQWVELR